MSNEFIMIFGFLAAIIGILFCILWALCRVNYQLYVLHTQERDQA